MPGGSGKLPGIFFAKGGRQEPGMAGDLQKIAEMKRKMRKNRDELFLKIFFKIYKK